ncbi:hypothetical protein SAMN05428967_4449 [Phyllobacterium sp. YR620]|nr:hypothetical protein SAMN05428967_4449 [Phyllobacterium sp. YR620]
MEHALTKYRIETGLSLEAFGALIGASKSMVWKWEAGAAIPRRKYLERIFTVTAGKVPPSAFVAVLTLEPAQ